MLTPYLGEFLVSPAALHLSLNWCSHGCKGCFANLRVPDRKADPKAIMRLLSDYPNRSTLVARLLQGKYPLLFSNLVDPFAASNYFLSVPILEVLTQLGIPVMFQTRGGRGVDDVLSFLPPSHWYISIPRDNEDLRKVMEPGAPPIADRFALIEKLLARGHKVSVGINPLVPEWLPDPIPLLKRLDDAGVENIWAAFFHLDNKQISNMPPKDKALFSENLMRRARSRTPLADEQFLFARVQDFCADAGMSLYSGVTSYRNDYWSECEKLYPVRFPTMQGFVNHLYDTWDDYSEGARQVALQEYLNYFLPFCPEGDFDLTSMARASHSHNKKTPPIKGFREYLIYNWKTTSAQASLAKLDCFAIAAESDGDDWVEIHDDGLPMYFFDPKGFDHYYIPVVEV